MTGQGRGVGSQNGYQVSVEATSVNRRQAETVVNGARELDGLEGRARDLVARYVSRGRVSVKTALQVDPGQEGGAAVRLNVPLAKAYHAELTKLRKALGLTESIGLDLVIRAPGVVQTGDDLNASEVYWPAFEEGLRQALERMVKMRVREGTHLKKDLQNRIKQMERSVRGIGRLAPAVVQRYREQLRARIADAGFDKPDPNDERLLREIVYFADRSDISEELSRLGSHFKQFRDCLKRSEPVGRTLDFLAQEMNREVNTIGSKANDSRISAEVVVLKTELEKFREQAQNIE